MPTKPIRPDRVTLNALLTSDKLTSGEKVAFQQMFDDIMNGRLIELSKKQRLWADSLYEKYKLGEARAQSRKQARVLVRSEATLFDPLNNPNRPLKPPGRV